MQQHPFRRIALLGVGASVVVAATACGSSPAEPAQTLSDSSRATVMQALDAAVAAGNPGVQVVVTEQGRTWTAASGVGDVASAAPFPENAHVRIGSNTKAFVATVMMQLVGAGSVELDSPVEKYLPGVLRGNGIDGNRITVRNLMQHTSGLPEYLELPELQTDSDALRSQQFDSADLVRRAMTMPAHFEPGAKAEYSNTNYLVVGMLVERVTGQPIAAEINRRIIEPLALRDTYFPAPGESTLRDPHPLGYESGAGNREDVTDFDPSWAGSAGAMISTGADLNRFFSALLSGGNLLPPAQLAEMRRDPKPLTNRDGIDYGLGLASLAVACGKQVWGHGGSIPGFRTYDGVTTDGRAVTVIVNQRSDNQAATTAVRTAFDTAICAPA